jgi:hypothetical protein
MKGDDVIRNLAVLSPLLGTLSLGLIIEAELVGARRSI